MKILRHLAIAASLFALSAVHAETPPPPLPPSEVEATVASTPTQQTENVTIILMRSDSLMGAANNATIWLDEVETGSIAAGTYLSMERSAGKAKVRIRPGGIAAPRISKTIALDTTAGETYYILAEPAFFGRYEMRILTKEEGMRQLEKFKKSTQEKIDMQRPEKER